jgi:hypothetical protein
MDRDLITFLVGITLFFGFLFVLIGGGSYGIHLWEAANEVHNFNLATGCHVPEPFGTIGLDINGFNPKTCKYAGVSGRYVIKGGQQED